MLEPGARAAPGRQFQLLRGYPFYRIDVGEYRVIYDLDGDVVRIILIGKRNDDEVYRRLRRKEGWVDGARPVSARSRRTSDLCKLILSALAAASYPIAALTLSRSHLASVDLVYVLVG